MIDEVYRNAFKEVYDILENTEDELLYKIPTKFMNLLKDNMNINYKTNIDPNIDIDKQQLPKETEIILSLIYRSYWATNEEKQQFAVKDKNEFEKRREEYKVKDIYQIFQQRKNLHKISEDSNLTVIKKDNFIRRCFNKILNMFKNNSYRF